MTTAPVFSPTAFNQPPFQRPQAMTARPPAKDAKEPPQQSHFCEKKEIEANFAVFNNPNQLTIPD
jgi:hypothetical protein